MESFAQINAIKWIIPILKKHNVQYEISGGFAAHIYGATRPINDIDIDISSENLVQLLPDIKNYIVYGPAPYKNVVWDLGTQIVLNYEDQLIDIADASNVKICDLKTQQWLDFSSKFNTSQTMKIYGIEVQVIDPHDLIEYKKILYTDNQEHQNIDIEAIQQYLAQNHV